MKKRLYVLSLLLLIPFAQAAGNEAYDPLGTWKVFGAGAAILAIFCILAVCFGEHMTNGRKKFLFSVMAIAMIATTGYFIVTTVMLNIASSTNGPVHWHADFEFYNCGERLDLIDPTGLSNKRGSTVFHEHDDDRIHVEGPVLLPGDVSLGEFFKVVGGDLTQSSMRYPLADGMLELSNGKSCNGAEGVLQVFVMKVENAVDHNEWRYTQSKISDFTSYVLSPQSQVPPGDCIIVEFGPSKDRTEHLCETFELAVKRGDLNGG